MMTRIERIGRSMTMRSGARALVMTLVFASSASAQEMSLDSLFRAHRMPLYTSESESGVSGFEFIIAEAAEAQFVMVGESHNLTDIPRFTADLFDALSEVHDFRYLVLENGPYAVEQFNRPGVRGDEAAAFSLANRYVNALQFRNDQEIEMIARVGSASKAEYDAVWGVDNAWGTLHLLDALVEEAPNRAAAELAEALAGEARDYEGQRPSDVHPRFITNVLQRGQLDALESSYEEGTPEGIRLLGILRTGFETYAARTSRPAIYSANNRRERLMRSQFMAHYRAAEVSGDPAPRAVLKFGQYHAMSGMLNWADVAPFGSFLRELARSHGSDMLSIWTGLLNEPGRAWTLHDFPDYASIASAGTTDRWWVVDLRKIRPFASAGAVQLNDEMRKVVFGFDLALLIGGGDLATSERLSGS